MDASDELTARQDQAILALLTCPSVRAAARRAGCSESCLRDWMRLAPFQARLRAARTEVIDRTLTDLVRASGAAVKALTRNLSSKAPPMAQIRAAAVLLEQAGKLVALADLAAQVAELKELLIFSRVEAPAAAKPAPPPDAGGPSTPPADEDAPGFDPFGPTGE